MLNVIFIRHFFSLVSAVEVMSCRHAIWYIEFECLEGSGRLLTSVTSLYSNRHAEFTPDISTEFVLGLRNVGFVQQN